MFELSLTADPLSWSQVALGFTGELTRCEAGTFRYRSCPVSGGPTSSS